MVKKKRQSDPSENGDDSTESCEENVKSACPHISKAVDLLRLRKYLKTSGFATECSECKKSGKTEVSDPDFEIDSSLWMCLRCGTQLCGRRNNKHAIHHFNTPHSDCHSMTANTTTWAIYCYICNNEVTASSSKKLHECIEYLKKQSTSGNSPKSLPPIELPPPVETIIRTDSPFFKLKDKNTGFSLPRVRGLSNLGNTCFFNSVMQCLSQTPYLLNVLQEMANPGEKFTLPGGKLKIKGENSEDDALDVEMPAITGQLGEWGLLTRTLSETIADLQSGEGGVYNPRKLLIALVTKLPQFGGGDQHDSHELLRHLLEGVRSEDLRRYQSVILSSLGISSKVDPAKVDGEQKQKVKFYGQQASDTMLRPEQVFRGFLVSTLECQECLHQSDRAEYFLDLSLPVASCRPQPPAVLRRKTPNEESNYNNQEDNKPSKHQLKKERLAARKNARKNKGNSTSKDENASSETNVKDEGKSSSEQSDADVEDNIEDGPRPADTNSVATQSASHTAANFAAYHMESGYNSEKVISSDSIRTSPVDLDKEKSDNTPESLSKDFKENSTSTTAVPMEYKPLINLENLSNPDSGVASPDATKHNSTETVDNVDFPINGKDLGSHSSLSSEINLDLTLSPQHNKLSPVKSEYDRPVSRISFVPECSNEVVYRGISIQGCKNLLEHSRESSQESLSESKNQESINDRKELTEKLSNYYNTINDNNTDNGKPENGSTSVQSPSPVPQKDNAVTPSGHNYDEQARPSNADAAKTTKEPSPSRESPGQNESDAKRGKCYQYAARQSPLSPRYADEDECSVQSCLSQFTALELLTGNNKVGCELCTERLNGKGGPTVYTNATKRLLVASPPATLILHLKRFQLGPRCLFRKMSKHVDFQAVLDLAPFCALHKARQLPHVARDQARLLYALYGVVEHSGGMHGGHYVAYVKVRRPVRAGDPRLRFLPQYANTAQVFAGGQADSESELSGYESGEAPPPRVEAPPGQWYYVSDSMVSEVSEDKVLRAQAYLLFYERIL